MRLQTVAPLLRVGDSSCTTSPRVYGRQCLESRSNTMKDPSGTVGVMDGPRPYVTSNTCSLSA